MSDLVNGRWYDTGSVKFMGGSSWRNICSYEGTHFETVVLVKGYDDPESQAKAKLISASPDLLVALKNLLQTYSEPDRQICCSGYECGCMGATVYQEAEHYARAAIAKAEGRA